MKNNYSDYTSKDLIDKMASGMKKNQSSKKVNKFLDDARNALINPQLDLDNKESNIKTKEPVIQSEVYKNEISKIKSTLKM